MAAVPLAQIKDVLVQGRNRIAKGWCQGQYATDALGMPIGPDSKYAEKFCALGAVRATPGPPGARDYLMRALPADFSRILGISHYNDDEGRTKEDMLALFDRAIELVQADIKPVKGGK